MKVREKYWYKNNKNRKDYFVLGVCIDATNTTAGRRMVLYMGSDRELYTRDEIEFLEKFKPC